MKRSRPTVDVSEFVSLKTQALQAHRTQIPDDWLLFEGSRRGAIRRVRH